jgi:Tol biopolymer transport system component
MNCEQVKELLSVYLDDTLAQAERQQIAQHLHICADCRAVLADFRRFDALLAQLPRVSPAPSLDEKIFSSPDYLELVGASYAIRRAKIVPSPYSRRNDPGRPRLVALPGGRLSAPSSPQPPPHNRFQRLLRKPWIQRTLLAAIAAILLITVAAGNFSGWNLWQKLANVIADAPNITPFAGQLSNPLPTGMRFVFLRDGALWSAAPDGKTSIARLTPDTVRVAANWAVRPPLPGHSAGNFIAYIDQQQGYVHIIRSNGQNDSTLPQPLLKQGHIAWNSEAGAAILSSLRWSEDGNTLAFVADPKGSGQTDLYLYSLQTEKIEHVTLQLKGVISQPVWSPDGVRIAFKLSHDGKTGILDYNTHSKYALSLVSAANTADNPRDTVLSLDWSPTATTPTVTWSIGVPGHIHSVWSQRVGTGHKSTALELASGEYTEASYSRTGNDPYGHWLLVTTQTGNLISVDLAGTTKTLTSGKQVSSVGWSPDGTAITYFDALSANKGNLHIINIATGNDAQIAARVAAVPAPIWSHDSQHLAYSTGSQIQIASPQTGSTSSPLRLQGSAAAMSWSVSSSSQLVLLLTDGEQGIYLLDTQKDTTIQINKERTNGPIWWTQIP